MPVILLLPLLLLVLLLALVTLRSKPRTIRLVLPLGVALVGLATSAILTMGYLFSRLWPDGPREMTMGRLYLRATSVFLAVFFPFICASFFLAGRTRHHP